MNQQKHFVPVLVGILGLTSLCIVLGTAGNTDSATAEPVEPKVEFVETGQIEEQVVENDSSHQFVAVDEVVVEAEDDIDQSTEFSAVDFYGRDLLAGHLIIVDPDSDLWDPELDCPDEDVWSGEEYVDPFAALEKEMVFWQEAIDITFDDLQLPGTEITTHVVQESQPEVAPEQEIAFQTDFDLEANFAELEWVPEMDETLELCEETVADDSFAEVNEDSLWQILVDEYGFQEFPIDLDQVTPEVDPLDVVLAENDAGSVEFDLPEDSMEAFADGIEIPENFFDSVEEMIAAEESFEVVEELAEVPVVDVEVLEESTEVLEVASDVVTETIEAEVDSTEVSSASTLIDEENRVADLRRYATDDIHRSNWKRALDELRELVTLRPYHADYHMTLGLIHRRLKDELGDDAHLEEAVRKYEEYSQFGGQEAIACLLLAEAHAASGDRETAFQFLERAASYGMNIARAVQQFPVLKKYTNDTRFVRSSLRLERYTLASVMTRDPFTGPWSQGENHDQRVFLGPFPIQQQQESLATAREAMAKVEYALRNRDESAAMDAYGIIEEIGSTVARFDQPELAGELRSIMERLDEVEEGIEQIRVTYLYEQARSKMEKMKKAFGEHNFANIDRLHGEVTSLAFSIDELGDSYSTASTLVVQAADQLQQRSSIVREFLSKEIHIEGVVVADEGSHAIIGGRWVPEGGQVFDGRLDQILRDRVVILYKGERITHRFSRF